MDGDQDITPKLHAFIRKLEEETSSFAEDNDRFLQLRHSLVQKETSLSVLKSQAWDEDIRAVLNKLETAVRDEFSQTEVAHKSIEYRRHCLDKTLKDVEGVMQQLLGVHGKLRVCLKGSKPGESNTPERYVMGWDISMSDTFAPIESMQFDTAKKKDKDADENIEKQLMAALNKSVPNVSLRDFDPKIATRDLQGKSQFNKSSVPPTCDIS